MLMLCYSGAMPTYCYTVPTGETVERIFPMGEAPPSIVVGGLEARRDYRAEQVGVSPTAGWPMKPCFASGVHPDQAQELRDHFKEQGVPTEVTSSGDVVYRNRIHRKKALKCRGFHDRASFD